VSIVIAALFEHGAVLAADPFVLDNAAESTSKQFDSQRLLANSHLGLLFASVGSTWVFKRAAARLKLGQRRRTMPHPPRLGSSWCRLSELWRKRRSRDPDAASRFREPSRSTLLMVGAKMEPSIIAILDSGQVVQPGRFAAIGSASHLTIGRLRDAGAIENQPLGAVLAMVFECFELAEADLFTTGFPVVGIATPQGVLTFEEETAEAWDSSRRKLREAVVARAERSLA
jgi:hypothetical protein